MRLRLGGLTKIAGGQGAARLKKRAQDQRLAEGMKKVLYVYVNFPILLESTSSEDAT
jgi:hypothetical protein